MRNLFEIISSATTNEFRIVSVKKESYELFFVHKKVETVRSTDTTTVKVTIYSDHDGMKGDYTFSIYPSDSDEVVISKVKDAERKALLTSNEMYKLPENETFHREIPSSLSSLTMEEVGSKIADAVFKADNYENGSINALEVFLNKNTVSVANSCGIDKSESKYSAMIEAIPTWNDNGESVELYEAYHFTELDEKAITEEIDRKMQEVRDRCSAKKPESELAVDVLLNAPELDNLFTGYAYNLSYSSVYMKNNLYSKGDDIQKREDGDAIDIEMRHEVKGSRYSALFDDDGTTLKDKKIVEDGMVCGYFGSNRFAQYLSEDVTGSLGCVCLKEGTLTEEELSQKPYFECVSMSGLQVDLYSDYIGGEVRLAYLHDGDKKVPLTGISISGKLSEVLPSIRFSNEKTVHEGYFGPKKALLKNVKII